jgi:ABC-2 type transport system ATP-binding protein
VALDGVSFSVPTGGVIGFVGPNGAGKTTTIRILMGLAKPTKGDAFVLGHTVAKPQAYLGRVGALIEAPAFYPQLSGRRNLEALAILGHQSRERVAELLWLVGLADRGDDLYRTYSMGMKQRLGIAAALLSDPDVLVLDEPTNGLDPAGIREIRGLLRSLGEAGKTVFVSSHLLAEVQRMCDHLVVLNQGRLVYAGSVDKLLANQVGLALTPADRRRSPALAALVRSMGFKAEEAGGSVLAHAPASSAAAINQRAMQAGILLSELRMQAADLEETVLGMTRGSA